MNEYIKSEKPFLLLMRDKEYNISYWWFESEEEMQRIGTFYKHKGYEMIDAIEIQSFRDVEMKLNMNMIDILKNESKSDWKESVQDVYKRVNNDTWICNQIEEFIDEISKNREQVAMRVTSETDDFYSFLRGVDYVIDTLKGFLYYK